MGASVTKAELIKLVYRLVEGFSGFIDHSTEMSLTSYGKAYLANFPGQNQPKPTRNVSPNQNLVGKYHSTHALASIALENVTLSVDDFNRKTKEMLVWYLSNKVTVSESFKTDSTHTLTINSDGSAHHEETEGYGFEDYTNSGTIGSMIKLGSNRYFYYNEVMDTYDLVFFKQLENNSLNKMVFNIDLTRFHKIQYETNHQVSTYSSAFQLITGFLHLKL